MWETPRLSVQGAIRAWPKHTKEVDSGPRSGRDVSGMGAWACLKSDNSHAEPVLSGLGSCTLSVSSSVLLFCPAGTEAGRFGTTSW